jgi:hypothetical protein
MRSWLSQPGQNAAYRGTAQGGGLSDAHAGPAFAPQALDAPDQLGPGPVRGTMRARTTVTQTGQALPAETRHPLGSALPAKLELDRSLVQAQSALDHTLRKFLSTINRKSSMMVVVHSISWFVVASKHQHPSSRSNGQQPVETSQLKRAVISLKLRGPEGPLFHGDASIGGFFRSL